jgi:hypothetical protein
MIVLNFVTEPSNLELANFVHFSIDFARKGRQNAYEFKIKENYSVIYVPNVCFDTLV